MKTDLARSLTETFEGHAQQADGGVEYCANHFAGVGEMVDLGLGSQRIVDDIMLTR